MKVAFPSFGEKYEGVKMRDMVNKLDLAFRSINTAVTQLQRYSAIVDMSSPTLFQKKNGLAGIVIGSAGIAGTDAAGAYTFFIDPTTGAASFAGTVTASAGAIGGFDIGSDYVRDAANSFGMASTVTGGDDVRFWAGATFANRATAACRITEAGAATFSNISVTGGNINTSGYIAAAGSFTVGGSSGSVVGNTSNAAIYGVYGYHSAALGFAVFGLAATGTGVYGFGDVQGVLGIGDEGVYGASTVFDGILGIGEEYGGWFSGDLGGIRASGTAAGSSGVIARKGTGTYSITAVGPMTIDEQISSTLATGTAPIDVDSSTPVPVLRLSKAGLKASGVVTTLSTNYVSGTGTAGADNTAQTVKTIAIAAATLAQVGDVLRIRVSWKGDTGAIITGTLTVNGVTVSAVSDSGGTALTTNEVWLHYIDATHANIVNGSASDTNIAGFNWAASQDVDLDQNAIASNHIIVYSMLVDIFPKGSTD